MPILRDLRRKPGGKDPIVCILVLMTRKLFNNLLYQIFFLTVNIGVFQGINEGSK